MSAQEPPLPPAIAESFDLADDTLSVHRNERLSMSSSLSRSRSLKPKRGGGGFKKSVGLENVARRTLGIILLLATVFLWTSSNFLASVSCSRMEGVVEWMDANEMESTYSQTTHIPNPILLLT